MFKRDAEVVPLIDTIYTRPADRRRRLPNGALALGLCVGTLATSAAHAQAIGGGTDATAPTTARMAAGTQAPATDDAAQAGARIEEIIVTAQRREENLQRVPVSVTALTAATLDRANINSTSGLQQVTPGLSWTTSNRTALPFIRGIGSSDISVGNESSVALYVDGVYIENSTAAMFALNNISRVEVLKGPQGTLFGRNATGGLIQIITKQPSDLAAGQFELGYANYRTISTNAYVTGPLAAHVSADLAIVYNYQDKGWGRNVVLDRDVDTDRTFSARSKLSFDYDDTKFTLAGDYTGQQTDIGSQRNIVPGRTGRPTRGVPTQPLAGFYDTQSGIDPGGVLKTGGVSLHAEHAFDFAKLTSITSYRQTKFTSVIDVDEVPAQVLDVYYNSRIKAVTQELQLASQSSGPFNWIFGGFYMHRNGRQPNYQGFGSLLGFPPFFGATTIRDGVVSEVFAPFGQATLKLATGTSITGGIRYTIEHQRLAGTQAGRSGIPFLTVDTKITYKEPTWRIAINQNFSNLMVYASYNRGFKSGAFNTSSLADPPARPETIDAYEIGFKGDFLDRRLRINAAAYQYNYKDIQLLVTKGISAVTVNAARARIRGAEASVEAVPVDRLTLSAGVSFIPQAKYLRFLNAPAYIAVPTGGNGQTSFDDSGGRMIRAPKFTATVSASYTFRVGGGDIDLGANLYHSSGFIFNPDALVAQSPYETLNGQIAYKLDSGLRIGVWGRNLLDKQYFAGASETSSASVYVPAPPRTYGVKLGFSF